jgi:hypothetical protein
VKEGDANATLLFNLSAQYATITVLEELQELKLDGRHHLPVRAGENLLGGNTEHYEMGGGTLFVASKKDSLKANLKKTTYILFSSHKNRGPHKDIFILQSGAVNIFGKDT